MEDPQLRQAAIDKARVGGFGGVRVWHARGYALITQVILMPRSTVHCAQCAVRDKQATKAKATRAGGEFSHNGRKGHKA